MASFFTSFKVDIICEIEEKVESNVKNESIDGYEIW